MGLLILSSCFCGPAYLFDLTPLAKQPVRNHGFNTTELQSKAATGWTLMNASTPVRKQSCDYTKASKR
jgi:hypothetical protein